VSQKGKLKLASACLLILRMSHLLSLACPFNKVYLLFRLQASSVDSSLDERSEMRESKEEKNMPESTWVRIFVEKTIG
jgi:hypothetical protein